MPTYKTQSASAPTMLEIWNAHRAQKAAQTAGTPVSGTAPNTGLTGITTTEGSEALGYRPIAANPLEAAEAVLKGTAAQMPQMNALASQITNARQQQLLGQIMGMYPQFLSTTNQIGQNISDLAQGNISQATKNQITQNIMERVGAGRGFGPDTQALNAALNAALGRTSESNQLAALQQQGALMSYLPTATPYDVSNLMVTPGAMTEAQNLANLYAAAPNPQAAYDLAAANAMKGLNLGARAGTTPNAASALLDNLINRTTTPSSYLGPGPGAGGFPNPTVLPSNPNATANTYSYDPVQAANWDWTYIGPGDSLANTGAASILPNTFQDTMSYVSPGGYDFFNQTGGTGTFNAAGQYNYDPFSNWGPGF